MVAHLLPSAATRSRLRPGIAALLLCALALGAAWAAPLRVAVLGDFNGPYGSTAYPALLERALDWIVEDARPDLLLSPGDVVAGQSAALPETRFAEMWASFDAAVAAPLRGAGIPYAFAIGNHDGSSLRAPDGSFVFGRERDAARAYWRRPMYQRNLAYLSREDAPFRTSFVFGPAFVALWDASSATIGEAQWRWLERELARPEARAASWRLVVGHLPLYPVAEGKDRPGEAIVGGDAARRRLERLGVDLYLSGHHAAYYPARVGDLTLLHAGGIGARRLVGSDAPPVSTATLLELGAGGRDLRIVTVDVATGRAIDPATLPPWIDTPAGRVTRLHAEPPR